MKVALITGISGQDGAYLSRFLLDKGYRVIGLTRNNHAMNLERLSVLGIKDKVLIEECDLMDISSIISIIRRFGPEEIYNLAAQSSVGLSFSQPIGTIHFNIVSVLNMLEAIRLVNPLIRFYQASSSEMYGRVERLPIDLNTPMHPLSPYAISKASAFWTVANYRESYGLFSCNGVLFNHESFLRTKNFFVKKVISEGVKNRHDASWVLKVGNLDVKRDFGYSPKYVEAMWLMLQHAEPRDFIICSGRSYLLSDIVRHIFSRLDIDFSRVVITKELYRPTDILDIYGDNRDARESLGWDYDQDFFSVLDTLIQEELANS